MKIRKFFSWKIEIVGCIIILLATPSSVAIIGQTSWSDSFPEDGAPEVWQFYAYNRGDGGGDSPHVPLTDDKYHVRVRDGALMAPYYSVSSEGGFFAIRSEAYHNSTAVLGTWSFDWIISEESHEDHGAIDYIGFIFNGKNDLWNRTGLDETAFMVGKTGYGLGLISRTKSELGIDPAYDPAGPGITFFKVNDTVSWGQSRKFSKNIYGTHHIDIQRTSEGEFRIYYDSVLIIEDTDNWLNVSEIFVFSSILGDSGIDNLVVTEEITTITPPATTPPELIDTVNFEHFLFVSLISITVLYFLKRRKKNFNN
ncbi:MAG: hypothetical protein ACXADY_26750 [Candidatus Hodarchaeales archaeon]